VLFLWTTSPMLADAMRVIEAWDFSYKTCAIWDKEVAGNGFWFRQQHELLLVAVRGNIMAAELEGRVSSVIRSRRGAHSVKPEIVHEIIEEMYPDLPRLELFARRPREGWGVWGNEVDVNPNQSAAEEGAA
jgi:N6-adenosine-specific RNA methylase IME4